MTRTTLVIDDSLFKRIKREALESRRTFKDTVMDILNRGLNLNLKKAKTPDFKFNTFKSGGAFVPIHDRNAVFSKMESGS